MTLIGPPSAIAPLTSGHPLGLPQTDTARSSDFRIASVSKSAGSPNTGTQNLPQERQQQRRNTPNDAEPKTTPPTILQLKINEMLEEQAEALKDILSPPKDPDAEPIREDEGVSKVETTDAAQESERPDGPMPQMPAAERMIPADPPFAAPAPGDTGEAPQTPPAATEATEPQLPRAAS
ncbi:hypothetical protein [Primorskyibacter sp. S187A]|uniref:hypothetical protein n=1 Tax=Primorskyibacter sp. S187A TaxID=3415130 RepID=UPI003C7AB248